MCFFFSEPCMCLFSTNIYMWAIVHIGPMMRNGLVGHSSIFDQYLHVVVLFGPWLPRGQINHIVSPSSQKRKIRIVSPWFSSFLVDHHLDIIHVILEIIELSNHASVIRLPLFQVLYMYIARHKFDSVTQAFRLFSSCPRMFKLITTSLCVYLPSQMEMDH